MTQKVATTLKGKSRSRKNMMEAKKGTDEILKKYPDLLEKIEEKMKNIELHPWVKKFGGIINTGKSEDKHSIFD